MGGISVGGGTLQGLSKYLISTENAKDIEELAKKGDRKNTSIDKSRRWIFRKRHKKYSEQQGRRRRDEYVDGEIRQKLRSVPPSP